MKLSDLKDFDPITIQCHDNPDADAIASGFALYRYFESLGKKVRFIYSGRNEIRKSNLKLMLAELGIDKIIEHVTDTDELLRSFGEGGRKKTKIPGLLITTDCQYGAGNVTKIPAERVAIIDHHQIETDNVELSEIVPAFGSCSTLVWKMLKKADWKIEDIKLGTALYYGLYTDTNAFSEIANPTDSDLRDLIEYDKTLIRTLVNCNYTLEELDIAGVAMIRHIYNPIHRYAIIKADQCDPNILGVISDFLLQVAEVDTCVVYDEWDNGIKFSTRSCVKEVHADELAAFLAKDVGSGGGHHEKAGGFISRALYDEKYPTLHAEAFFSDRMNDYFDNCEIIVAKDYEMDTTGMQTYSRKKDLKAGYVFAKDIFPIGTPITIRTLEGDFDLTVSDDLVIMIGIKGEVYSNIFDKFRANYVITEEPYMDEEKFRNFKYIPTIRNRATGDIAELGDMAKVCYATGRIHIHAKELDKRTKIFPVWAEDKYMLGEPGDYIAVRSDDSHDCYIVEKDIFVKTYEEYEPDESEEKAK